METLRRALELDPDNEDVRKLLDDISNEFTLDNTLSIDHPER
jgi:hypothetical protein